MGVKITQPGEAKAAAQAGTIIGKSERAKEDRARAEREQARADQMAAQREARKAAMKWEQEKMALRSQQDFQQELTEKQWEFEKFNRAKAWEIEKMQMVSQLDFEREEKKRAQEMEEGEIGLKSIQKQIDDGMITGEEPYIQERQQYFTDKAAGTTAPSGLYNIPASKGSALSLLDSTTKPEPIKGIKTVVDPKTKEPVYVPEGQPFVTVRLPNGSIKKIRVEQLQEAMDSDGAIYIPATVQGLKPKKSMPPGMDDETFYLHSGAFGGF